MSQLRDLALHSFTIPRANRDRSFAPITFASRVKAPMCISESEISADPTQATGLVVPSASQHEQREYGRISSHPCYPMSWLGMNSRATAVSSSTTLPRKGAALAMAVAEGSVGPSSALVKAARGSREGLPYK